MRTLLIFISFQNVNCAMDHGIDRAGVVPLPGAESNATSGVGSDTTPNTKSNSFADDNNYNNNYYSVNTRLLPYLH